MEREPYITDVEREPYIAASCALVGRRTQLPLRSHISPPWKLRRIGINPAAGLFLTPLTPRRILLTPPPSPDCHLLKKGLGQAVGGHSRYQPGRSRPRPAAVGEPRAHAACAAPGEEPWLRAGQGCPAWPPRPAGTAPPPGDPGQPHSEEASRAPVRAAGVM